MTAGAQRRGLLVDRLIGHQDIVVKGLDPALGRPAVVSGTTILGDGRVACILDVVRILEGAGHANLTGARPSSLCWVLRTRSLLRPRTRARRRRPLHLLTFALDREEYGIPVTQVREVIRVNDITRVPQVPAHVRGVTNLRGRILAVVEIRTRLGLAEAVVTPSSRVVVVDVRGRTLGLLVDRVSQVTKVPADSVTPPPGRGGHGGDRFPHRSRPLGLPAHHAARSRQGAAAERVAAPDLTQGCSDDAR